MFVKGAKSTGVETGGCALYAMSDDVCLVATQNIVGSQTHMHAKIA